MGMGMGMKMVYQQKVLIAHDGKDFRGVVSIALVSALRRDLKSSDVQRHEAHRQAGHDTCCS
jgi:hypothetical protein